MELIMKKATKSTPADLQDLINTAVREKVSHVPYFTNTLEPDAEPPPIVTVGGYDYTATKIGILTSVPIEGVGSYTEAYKYECKDFDNRVHSTTNVYSFTADLIKEALRIHFAAFGFDPVKIELTDGGDIHEVCTELNRMCKNVKYSISDPKYGDNGVYIHATTFVPFTSGGVSRKIPKDVEVSRPYFSVIGFLRICTKILKQPSVLADGFTKNLVINAKAVFGSDSISEQTMRYNGQYLKLLAERYGIQILVRGKIPIVDRVSSAVSWTTHKTWSTKTNAFAE